MRIATAARLTWLTTRTRAVSCVPHWRAKLSNAISRMRWCSRTSVVGRRKS
ncbi:Uncharacterised protein [Mycobacteroides abscessus]|nr:Uncharacterised protein [Mycobacteroides abscessus]